LHGVIKITGSINNILAVRFCFSFQRISCRNIGGAGPRKSKCCNCSVLTVIGQCSFRISAFWGKIKIPKGYFRILISLGNINGNLGVRAAQHAPIRALQRGPEERIFNYLLSGELLRYHLTAVKSQIPLQ